MVASEPVSITSEGALTPENTTISPISPIEAEWLANITNEKTKRFYKSDVAEFIALPV